MCGTGLTSLARPCPSKCSWRIAYGCDRSVSFVGAPLPVYGITDMFTECPYLCGREKGVAEKRMGASSSDGGHADAAPFTGPAAPARRGTLRQRMAENDEGEPTVSIERPLTDNMKRRWAMGELSSVALQDIAHNAQKQGAAHLESIVAAGTHGKHATNLFRDLVRLLGKPVGDPPIDWVELPLKSGRKVPHPVIWPHKFFSVNGPTAYPILAGPHLRPRWGCFQFWD